MRALAALDSALAGRGEAPPSKNNYERPSGLDQFRARGHGGGGHGSVLQTGEVLAIVCWACCLVNLALLS